MNNYDTAEQQTRLWLKDVVIGLGLCPFAEPVYDDELIRYAVCKQTEWSELFQWSLLELDTLQQSSEQTVATSLLIYPNALQDFSEFLDFFDELTLAISDSGLAGVIQAVAFHPHFMHHGYPEEDPSHYTNRAPYPIVHLLRFAQLQRLEAQYPDLEKIPERNSERLASLGEEALKRLWKS